MFEADFEEGSNSNPSPFRRTFKKTFQRRQDNKYGGAITKAIINPFDHDPQHTNSPPPLPSHKLLPITLADEKKSDRAFRRTRRQKTLPQLQPFKQMSSTLAYSYISQQPPVPPPREKTPQAKINHLTLPNSASRLIFYQDSDEQPTPPPLPPPPTETPPNIVEGLSKSSLLFEMDSESNCLSARHKEEEFVDLPQNRMLAQFTFHEQSEDQAKLDQPEQKKSQEVQKVRLVARGDDLDCNIAQRRKRMSEAIPPNTTFQMLLHRDKGGFNSFWPEFHLRFAGEHATLLAAKRISSKPFSTFILSSNRNNFTENSTYYLGKLKGSLFGDMLNLYGQGLNPSDAKSSNCIPREMLATIIFAKTPSNCPRQFQVYVRKPQYRYYLNFPQAVMYRDEVPLSQLYQYPENRNKIDKYRNRKPVYNEKEEVFMLDFRGKAQCRSIKNFILQGENGEEMMMFGKIDDSTFNIIMSHPLSPLVAMAVALNTFDSRIIFAE